MEFGVRFLLVIAALGIGMLIGAHIDHQTIIRYEIGACDFR